MGRAEAAAAAAREAALAEIRAAKELSATEQAVGSHGGFARLIRGPGKETKREEAASDEEQDDEVSDGIKICEHSAASFVWAFGNLRGR